MMETALFASSIMQLNKMTTGVNLRGRGRGREGPVLAFAS